MAIEIFPSVNNVNGGKVLTEENLASMFKLFVGTYVASGLTVPATSVSLDLAVAVGEALISGYDVVVDIAMTATCTANQTNHIYLQLTFDNTNNVTGADVVTNITGVSPTNAVKLATAVAGASTVTSTVDVRRLDPFGLYGHAHTGVDGQGPVIDAGTLDGSHSSAFATAAQGALAADAVSTNTASRIVRRDANGDFAARIITASLAGNASGSSGSCTGNAATVTTNANLSGDVTSVGNVTTLARVSPTIITLFNSEEGFLTTSTADVYIHSSAFRWRSEYATGRSIYLSAVMQCYDGTGTCSVTLTGSTGSDIITTTSANKNHVEFDSPNSLEIILGPSNVIYANVKTSSAASRVIVYAVRLLIR